MKTSYTIAGLYLCLFCTLLSSAQAAPALKRYQFEMIVFRQSEGPALESWPNYPPQRFFSTHPTAVPANLMPDTECTLNKETELIGSHYPILLHLAWQESLPPNGPAQTVHISGGQVYNRQGALLEDADTDATHNTEDNTYPTISGDITVRLQHYFEVN